MWAEANLGKIQTFLNKLSFHENFYPADISIVESKEIFTPQGKNL